jgi:quercetin dioxygenase-like cupin family protein
MATDNEANVSGGNTLLRLASVNVDNQGESYFGYVEAADPPGTPKERNFPIAYWQVWQTKPGYYADFRTVDAPKALAVMSGRLEVTVSTGETRYFSAGDTFFLQDVRGKGHAIRTIGKLATSVMLITLTDFVPELP